MVRQERKGPRVAVAIAALWRSLKRDLFGGYRPELHYMRGPGPKWRAKHATEVAVMATADALA